jgi:hypothetical protein
MALARESNRAAEARVVVGAAAGAPGHAEGGEGRGLKLLVGGEELGIERIGAGIAALDIVEDQQLYRNVSTPVPLEGQPLPPGLGIGSSHDS